jgi:hypothetical protein
VNRLPDTQPIKRFDLRKVVINHSDFLAQAFYMAVYRSIVDINMVAISVLHQTPPEAGLTNKTENSYWWRLVSSSRTKAGSGGQHTLKVAVEFATILDVKSAIANGATHSACTADQQILSHCE